MEIDFRVMSDLTEKTENEERELQSEQPVQQNIYDYYSIKANGFESVVDYTTKLSNFEGPLDLLLYLVNKRAKTSKSRKPSIYSIKNRTNRLTTFVSNIRILTLTIW